MVYFFVAAGPAGVGLAAWAAFNFRLFTMITSTRRFRDRPSGVSFVSTGEVSARPTIENRPCSNAKVFTNTSITAIARAQDSSQLLLNRELWMGIASV